MLDPTCAACHQILMLLLTCLWKASPSVCEETRQDLPPQLPPRCAGLAVHGELSGTEALSPTVPPGTRSIPHLSPAPSAQGLGEAEMNQTRSLPTKSPQSAGGGNAHINHSDPRGWGQTEGTGRRGSLGRGGLGKLFLYQRQRQERGQRGCSAGPSGSSSSAACSSA